MVNITCAVPRCSSTKINTPEKHFFSSPNVQKKAALRAQWLKAMRRRVNDLSRKTNFFVCEDHFDLKNDVENYFQVTLGQYKKMRLRPSTVPSIFKCQGDKNKKETERASSVKRTRTAVVQSLLVPSGEHNDTPAASEGDTDAEFLDVNTHPTHQDRSTMTTYLTAEKSTMCSIRLPYRSVGLQCKLSAPVTQAVCELLAPVTQAVSIFEPEIELREEQPSFLTSFSSQVSQCGSVSSEYVPSTQTSDTTFTSINDVPFYLKRPREYLGITHDAIGILDALSAVINASVRDICIVIIKIRKNYTMTDLGDRFQLSERRISAIFGENVLKIAECMKTFLQWPSARSILLQLPTPFRLNYSDVIGILDCFEIEIQKPENPILQSLSWSDYKKGNTIKYLIVCTPDGRVCYVSTGFGGRASDTEIVEKSGFLQVVPTGGVLMADRGFKHVEEKLRQHGCRLVRPPSVEAGKKLTKYQVRLTKQVASLRIHIERAIRRASREFNLLKCHSVVQHHLIKYLDHCVLIGCGLANLQPQLIRTE